MTWDTFHLAALCKFVHQFVEVPDLLGQRCFDFLDSISTNGASDQAGMWIDTRFRKRLLKGYVRVYESIQIALREAGQPCYDFVQFFDRSPFFGTFATYSGYTEVNVILAIRSSCSLVVFMVILGQWHGRGTRCCGVPVNSHGEGLSSPDGVLLSLKRNSRTQHVSSTRER